MQYYIQTDKLKDIINSSPYSLDDVLDKCAAYSPDIQTILDGEGYPTRNNHLIASLCQALSCSSLDFALRKFEDADESVDPKTIKALLDSPLDYDKSHFH